MNVQLLLAVIYFHAGIYAWRPFYHNLWNHQKSQIQFPKSDIEDIEVFKKNSTNHTFIDEDEYMKLLRFYRPI
jgi:hypothetical protein